MENNFQPDRLCLKCMHELPAPGAVCPNCGFSVSAYTPAPHHLPPYTILKGCYMLGAVLGEGGFGITYCAYDLNRARRVAVKELFIIGVVTRENSGVTLVDQSFNGRAYYEECRVKFQQEAEALASLKDKNGVVSIEDFFAQNNTGYIVMEYLDGDDLLTYLKKNGGRIPFQDAYKLLRPIMKSMVEIHRLGIIHRDVSPDNIRYLSNRQMKLMDFGSVKFTSKDSHSMLVMAKPGYTPPEQYSKDFKVGPWMDVYAMAATIYRCITGKTPKASIDRKDDADLEPVSSYGVNLPDPVWQVICKGMALKAEDRYQDMLHFYEALKEAAGYARPDQAGLPDQHQKQPYPPVNPQPPQHNGAQDPGYRALVQQLDKAERKINPAAAFVPGILLDILFFVILYFIWWAPK